MQRTADGKPLAVLCFGMSRLGTAHTSFSHPAGRPGQIACQLCAHGVSNTPYHMEMPVQTRRRADTRTGGLTGMMPRVGVRTTNHPGGASASPTCAYNQPGQKADKAGPIFCSTVFGPNTVEPVQ